MRMPTVFIPHGGGPWPFVELGLDPHDVAALRASLEALAEVPPVRPAAVVVVTAHWEAVVPTVSSAERPGMLYDYSGFPEASYRLTWPAPGSPVVAARVRQLLEAAGFETAEDGARGFDHGTFVPMKVAYPEADIPTVQLSLKRGLGPAEHLAMGRALAPLRDEGVFLVGSGMSFHNLRLFGDPRARPLSAQFDGWLHQVMRRPAAERDRALAGWSEAPAARLAHPREEHLLPLMVVAGAAGEDGAALGFDGYFNGWKLSAFHFGA